MNLAAVWKLPVIFVVENNQYGALDARDRAVRLRAALATAAVGYGIAGETVDGNDVLAVLRRGERAAAERARRGDGPTLLEFKTFRMRGHEEASGTAYVPQQLFEEWAAKDPVARVRDAAAGATGVLTAADARRRCAPSSRHADRSRSPTRRSSAPEPESTRRSASSPTCTRRPSSRAPCSPDRRRRRGGPRARYVDAISRRPARGDAPRSSTCVLLGQDIAEYGGVFKVTEGFVEEFGKARVRNTPIIESGALGAALGLALDGFRPMVEMQFGDFITCGFNQIVNNLAKTHYRWGARRAGRRPRAGRRRHGRRALPLAERRGLVHARGRAEGGGAGDALRREGPAARGRSRTATRCSTSSTSSSTARRRVPCRRATYTVPIGPAQRRARRRDATIVTYGVGVAWALEAAAALAARRPLDRGRSTCARSCPGIARRVLASVRKTGRALVLHEAPLTGGFGGEIAAGDRAGCVRAGSTRRSRASGGLDMPVPFSKALEEIFSPKGRLVGAIRSVLAY